MDLDQNPCLNHISHYLASYVNTPDPFLSILALYFQTMPPFTFFIRGLVNPHSSHNYLGLHESCCVQIPQLAIRSDIVTLCSCWMQAPKVSLTAMHKRAYSSCRMGGTPHSALRMTLTWTGSNPEAEPVVGETTPTLPWLLSALPPLCLPRSTHFASWRLPSQLCWKPEVMEQETDYGTVLPIWEAWT